MHELMLYLGIAVAGASVVAGIIAFAALAVSKRRINEKLDQEYGDR